MSLQLCEYKKTTLNMLPVCEECNAVIRDVEIHFDKEKVKNFLYSYVKILPSVCQNCGAHIDGLKMDGEYVKLFIRNNEKIEEVN